MLDCNKLEENQQLHLQWWSVISSCGGGGLMLESRGPPRHLKKNKDSKIN